MRLNQFISLFYLMLKRQIYIKIKYFNEIIKIFFENLFIDNNINKFVMIDGWFCFCVYVLIC